MVGNYMFVGWPRNHVLLSPFPYSPTIMKKPLAIEY